MSVKKYENILDKLVSGLHLIYGKNLYSVVVYGSVARGTDCEDSDIDIAVIVLSDDSVMHEAMLDLNVDLELECGKVLSLITIEQDEYVKWNNISPFYKNVKDEGIVLWKAA